MVKQLRSNHGLSIAELMVTALILVTSMAFIGQIIALVTIASVKTSNTVEGLEAARFAINRIESDIRLARGVGDICAWGAERLEFPAAANPIYGSKLGNPPSSGWPGLPWGAMKLSESVLVLQLPVFVRQSDQAAGMPLMLKSAPRTPNVDTVVYEILADPARPGEYKLQVARFPGVYSDYAATIRGTINPPTTLLKGIVGPRQKIQTSNSAPAVFSYLLRQSNAGFTKYIGDMNYLSAESVRGVGIDLEIKKTGLINRDGPYPANFAIHSETLMRNYTL